MPKELTHWILAERALYGLNEDSRLRGVMLSHRAAFLGGAVLPDTLLHLFRGPYARTALSLGHRFHDTLDNSFAPLILAEANCPGGLSDDLLACLLGVICHMQADIVFHPFVYALGGIDDIGRHYRLETAIDVHLLCNGAVPPVRHFAELVTPDSRALLVASAGLLFDPEKELPPLKLDQALSMHCRLQNLYDRTGWKITAGIISGLPGSPFREQRHLFYPLNPVSAEFAGIAGLAGEWRHPVSGVVSRSSVDDLAADAVLQTISVFRRIESRGSLAAALKNPPGANLLTGVHGIGKAAMQYASGASETSRFSDSALQQT
jgi:hypothetical protein